MSDKPKKQKYGNFLKKEGNERSAEQIAKIKAKEKEMAKIKASNKMRKIHEQGN